MTLIEYDKLTPDERKEYFYNCKMASACKLCGSIICMYGCKGRIVVENNDSMKK